MTASAFLKCAYISTLVTFSFQTAVLTETTLTSATAGKIHAGITYGTLFISHFMHKIFIFLPATEGENQ